MRLLLRLAAVALALALLALGGLWWRLDRLTERVIERGASEQLGVRTEIDGLLLRPLSGILSLRGLTIANPPGYAGDFLALEEARGRVDLATLRNDVIVVPEIGLRGAALTLEEQRSGSNYAAILGHAGAEPRAAAAEAGPSVRVETLVVRDIRAELRLASAPPLVLQIPELRLRDLGGPGGATSGQITAEVVRAILGAVATEAPGVPVAFAARLLGTLGLSRAAGSLLDAGERGLDAARDALRGLLR